jgi:hypothetical protein
MIRWVVNWTGFISKRSWPIQGTITALRGDNWRKTRKPVTIWRIRAGMWTSTSRTQVQSATDTPQTLRQNPSCTKSFWLSKLAWPGWESGVVSDFFLSRLRPAKRGTDFGKTKYVQILGVQLGIGQQPSYQTCYYRLMFIKYIVCLWFTQYTGPAQVTQ